LITGGSRGIGKAAVLKLAKEGHVVVFTYKKEHKKAEAVVSLGGAAHAIQADVSQESDILKVFKFIDEKYGSIDNLVNNVGILHSQTDITQIQVSRLKEVFETNVIGAFVCTREAVERMSKACGGQGGSIMNISSAAARLGAPKEYVDYAASKGALDSMTRGVALEVADQGIRVNAIRPGFIYTDIHADGGEADRVNRVAQMIPMKRGGGTPKEVADVISWLLSPSASYITNNLIDVAGGKQKLGVTIDRNRISHCSLRIGKIL
tara:strand:+ start:6993 stop:7784 length:792 start_codon:yes stop_codon:yes gene_type:complete